MAASILAGGALLVLAGLASAATNPPAPGFDARMANPPSESRILKIIHGWPDAPEAQDRLIAKLSTQGFGGVVCNLSFDQYLRSEPRWESFVRAVRAAKQAGMAMWLYDERGYPSGNAGGLTLAGHPEWEARGLLVTEAETYGGSFTLALPPGRPVLVGAFPVVDGRIEVAAGANLTALARDGKLLWPAPRGHWRVIGVTEGRLYEGTHADGNLWSKMPYINLLMPEPTARFLELTHQAYASRLGGDLGRYFMASFTDEPSLMSLYLSPMPYRPLPWAPNLPGEFLRRRGYPLEPRLLPALVTDAGPATAKTRYDFWLTVGELVSESFFGQIQTWGRQHRLPSGGHPLLEEGLVAQVPLYGDFFRCIRRLDAPSIDCLTSLPPEVPWYIARLLASAAELEGHSLVMCETSDHGQVWRAAGDARPKRIVTESEIRGTCNRLIVSGVNCITSYYSFSDLSDDQLRRLNEWVGRCCAALAGGHQVADVALVYPVETLWTRFTPSRHWAGEAAAAQAVESLYRGAAESLFAARRDFTVLDSRALAEARVEDGALVQGPLRWRVLVLPGVDTLPLAAWQNLARFVRGGGVAVALGALPANSEKEFPSPAVTALGRDLFGAPGREPAARIHGAGGAGVFLPAGSEALLPMVMDGALDPDLRVEGARQPLRVTHRRLDGHDVYFVINDSGQPWSGEVRLPAAVAGQAWDPQSGRAAAAVREGLARLKLDPYGATLLRFEAMPRPARKPFQAGPLPNLALTALPRVEPTSGHGEFVRAELGLDDARSTPAAPMWRAGGSITRGQVDTFLFAQFRYTNLLDLGGSDCLAVDTWVPDGQRTPGQVLVILRERDGGDFVATTSRSLAAAGRERSYLPWSQFQLAGWSKDADGVLDLKRVGEVRVGWGGYLGQQGERVVFSVGLPSTGHLASPAVSAPPLRPKVP